MKETKRAQVLDTLEEIADPRHTALLVIDIQNDNASPRGMLASKGRDISWVRKTLPNIKTVLEEARRLGVLVIFMRMTRSKDGSHDSGPLLRLQEMSAHGRGLAEYEIEGTWGNEVLDELEPRPSERQVIKYRSSAFIGTTLDIILRSKAIRSAVAVGLVTEGCVESTVRHLIEHGYYTVVLSDCVSSSSQDMHDAALLKMSARCDVMPSEALLKVWRPARVAHQGGVR
ncbi:MAG: cysteine hydrolase [Chloroflexi bacterium]|nr:cysteine hydrolase [Chloroflexota bacterium]